MKKCLRYANLLALGLGAVGMLLQYWLFSGGTDEKGLHPASHPGWILLGILSVAAVVLFWLLSRQAGTNRSHRQNFPSSFLAAFGCCAGTAGLLFCGIFSLRGGNSLDLFTGVLGIGGGLAVFWGAVCRFRNLRHVFPIHCLPCFFFALQLFVLGQEFGSEPEMCRYLYRFWAIAASVPACYWLWSFDVGLGNRPKCLFWCLTAGYFHLVAAIGGGPLPLHLGVAAWMLTALPRLTYLPKPAKPAPEETPQEPIPEAPQPAEDPTAAQLPDTDAIIEQLLQDLK